MDALGFSFYFSKPLKKELHKKYNEHVAFSVLKKLWPAFFEDFILSDRPDLQQINKAVGIEITEAIQQGTAQINGEFSKMIYGKKSERERLKCKQLIERNRGKVDDISVSYPSVTLKDEIKLFQDALINKMNLLSSYREAGFEKVGLFILYNDIPIPFDSSQSINWFTDVQNEYTDRFDFLFFCYHCGIIYYDFSEMSYNVYSIGSDVFDKICLSSRMEVEAKYDNGE